MNKSINFWQKFGKTTFILKKSLTGTALFSRRTRDWLPIVKVLYFLDFRRQAIPRFIHIEVDGLSLVVDTDCFDADASSGTKN